MGSLFYSFFVSHYQLSTSDRIVNRSSHNNCETALLSQKPPCFCLQYNFGD